VRRTAWDAAIAGYGTGSRVEYLLVPRVFGLGGPLVAMVGTNMGAGQRDRAMRAAWIGAAMATGLTAMIASVLRQSRMPGGRCSTPILPGSALERAQERRRSRMPEGLGRASLLPFPTSPGWRTRRHAFLVYTCICMFLPGDWALEE